MARVPETRHAAGDHVHGFTLVKVTPLPALFAVAYQLEHDRTGARLLHVHADDEENLFSISFPTLPRDHTGVAHVLEHAVLSGSARFPVRDPFFEMVKMSMATFVNAMTGWDCTYYPVASNVKRDLFNLAEVYFDAVFHPLLTEETFRREGHHLAVDEDGRLTVKGIVYNEMKGVFSDPRSVLYRRMSRLLFPDTVYGMESGGDPLVIPDLTWEGLREFHRTFYHPGNAYFVFYGDVPTQDHLAFLKERLEPFSRRDGQAVVAEQPRWRAPRRVEETYPVGRDESVQEQTYLALHWLTGSALDPEFSTLFSLLDYILFGNEAAPLKKAIIDSKLGQDLLYSGSTAAGREDTFCIGLKGSEPDRAERFEALVFEVLGNLAERPFAPEQVETAFRQAAYHVREIQTQYPLTAMERVLQSWIYGGDPLLFLRLPEHLEHCRRLVQQDPLVFSRLIRERLLHNPHRVLGILRPDPDQAEREARAFAERMERVRTGMSQADIDRVARAAAELEMRSGTPNPPEAVATLPQLRTSDLPRKPRHIETSVEHVSGVPLLRNDVFSNGVCYLDLDFDLQGLPDELWPYVPYLTDAVEKMGVRGLGYEETARRVAAATGGLSANAYFETAVDDPGRLLLRLRFHVKTLEEQMDEALELVRGLLFSVDPRDAARLRDVIGQARSALRNHLVHSGSSTAVQHAGRGLSLPSSLSERVFGLPQLALIERLHGAFDDESGPLMEKIEAIRDFLLARGRMAASFTGTDKAYAGVRRAVAGWSEAMRTERGGAEPPAFQRDAAPRREGLAGPIQVAHCALVMPAPHFSHADGALLNLGARILSLDYLINEIRFKGNAYGASCSFDGLDMVFSMNSYRDPHVARTLQVFEGVREHVAQAVWTQDDIDRAIIGTAKHDGAPIRPGPATAVALSRYLRGYRRELREARYEQLLAATPASVKRALLDAFDANLPYASVCVVSSEAKLREANEQMARPLEIRPILEA